MKKSEYKTIENYMLDCMNDSAHDPEHVMRVLYTAMHIAGTENGVDEDILIAACLLHDIGREAQFKDSRVCHAAEGGNMAEHFLLGIGWDEQPAKWVHDCIRTHRFRSDDQPVSLEAKILFDSDKLEAAGALGIARTLMYQGQVGQLLYTKRNGQIVPGTEKGDPGSFYKEYNKKLKNIYTKFYTGEALRIAEARRSTAETFFNSLVSEVDSAYDGKQAMENRLEE